MLSKEEKEALLIFNNIECNRLSDTENEAIVIISNLIDQLKSNKQKLIEKLEKDVKKNNEFEFMPLQIEKAYNNYYKLGKIDEAQEILKILKGDKE